ncbi:hypothetical protein ABIF55_008508 [Bradyrhizobium diazoefficiens]
MIGQQLLRLRGRPEDAALPVDREQEAAGDVERGARALGQAGVAEMDTDARQHLLDHDRLGHVVDAAGVQPAHDMLGLGEARHEDHGDVGKARIALEAAAGLEAVDAGHHRIEQHDVGRDLLDDAHRRRAVERHHHRHPGAVERVGEQPQRLGRVIDNERDVALL